MEGNYCIDCGRETANPLRCADCERKKREDEGQIPLIPTEAQQ